MANWDCLENMCVVHSLQVLCYATKLKRMLTNSNTVTVTHTVTQYLLMNVTNAQTLKKGTRNETEVMEN